MSGDILFRLLPFSDEFGRPCQRSRGELECIFYVAHTTALVFDDGDSERSKWWKNEACIIVWMTLNLSILEVDRNHAYPIVLTGIRMLLANPYLFLNCS